MDTLQLEQGTEEWHRERLCRITGTRLKDLMTTKGRRENLMNELLSEKLTGRKDIMVPTPKMERGIILEDTAIEEYEKRFKIKTESVGFCISDDCDLLALSPDRLVSGKESYIGAVEVKCPDTKTMIGYILKGIIPKDYHWQIVQYFTVVETLEWLDFAVLDPRLPGKLNLFVLRVNRKDYEDIVLDVLETATKFKLELNDNLEKLKKLI